MVKAVKPRPYQSALRREQALGTRTRIARSAAELFASHGYTQTSIEQIAARAGVARPTVYIAFTGKPALLKEAVDLMLAGDDAPVPVRDRPWVQEVLGQRDQHLMLQLQARNDRVINQRVAPLYEAVRNAAATDDDIAQLYATLKHQRLTGARITVEALAALGPLRDDLDLDTGTDLLWALKDPALWTALVTDRGWPADRYQTWLARAMQQSLLPSQGKQRSRARERN
jgi:TetR/AcrR family transcriptional regulator, regulator of autoinduction and epiphytic fitness